MKKVINIIFLFTLLNNAQNFKAVYKINFKKINYDSILKTNKNLKAYNKDIYKNYLQKRENSLHIITKKAKLILLFNRKNSIFFMDKMLSLEEKELKGFKIRTEMYGLYYSSKYKTLEYKTSYGQEFMVNIPKYKWSISAKTKKIGNYNCFRATTIKEVENSKGKHQIKITAWFTPDIPFNYGPKEFNGLPGLILELNQGEDLFFRLKELKENVKIKIKKPTKGKNISLKEFNSLSKKMYENRSN